MSERSIISVKAEHIYTFNSFSEWVNKASSRLGGFGKSQKIICVDTEGNYCHQGEDFMIARDNNLFPVKAYRLVRTNERIL